MNNDRASLTVGDGNGNTKLIIDMKMWQWVVAMTISCIALFAGAYQAVYYVSTTAVEKWYHVEGKIVVQEQIDSAILAHTLLTERKNAAILSGIEKDLARISGVITASRTKEE